jgi:hypothetical protein
MLLTVLSVGHGLGISYRIVDTANHKLIELNWKIWNRNTVITEIDIIANSLVFGGITDY